MFTLSVIMGTYDDEKYVRQAIEAILNQSFKGIEFIIINDASPDNSDLIIREYAKKDSRIKYLINERNQGLVKTANRGVKAATGKYLYWASSDDYVLPGFFERVIPFLEKNPQVPLCCANYGQLVEATQSKTSVKLIADITQPTLFSKNEILKMFKNRGLKVPGHTCIIRTGLIKNRGLFDPELGHFADFVFYNYLAMQEGCLYIPEEFSLMRVLDQHTKGERKKKINQLDIFVSGLKKTPAIWECFYRSSLTARMVNSKLYTLFLKPKHWDIVIPMSWLKLKLLFKKLSP